MRRTALLLALPLLLCCGESHTADDGGRPIDAPVVGADADGCRDLPPIPRCVDERCCAEERPARLGLGCRYECPPGSSSDALCEASPSCNDFASPCARHDECGLAITDCCGPCGVPTLADFDAIRLSASAEHAASVCDDPSGSICPDCPSAMNPSLGATCRASRCEGFDVRTLELSACTSDADCRLRVRECCECGGTTDPFALIAISIDGEGAYGELVCDELACPECAPAYPDTVEAYCETDGHCAVRPAP